MIIFALDAQLNPKVESFFVYHSQLTTQLIGRVSISPSYAYFYDVWIIFWVEVNSGWISEAEIRYIFSFFKVWITLIRYSGVDSDSRMDVTINIESSLKAESSFSDKVLMRFNGLGIILHWICWIDLISSIRQSKVRKGSKTPAALANTWNGDGTEDEKEDNTVFAHGNALWNKYLLSSRKGVKGGNGMGCEMS